MKYYLTLVILYANIKKVILLHKTIKEIQTMKFSSLSAIVAAASILVTSMLPQDAQAQSITWNPNTGTISTDITLPKLPNIPESINIPVGNNGNVNIKLPSVITGIQLPQTTTNNITSPVGKYTGKSVIAIDMDDNKLSQKEVYSVLNSLRIPVTFGVITDANTDKFDPEHNQYKSDADIKNDSRNPLFFFASHTVSHLDLATQNASVVRQELLQSRNRLQQLVVRKVDYVILPYCSTNAAVNIQIQAIYNFASICGGNDNPKGKINPYAIDRKIVESTTTLTQFQTWIDEAKKVDKLTVFVYHDTAAKPTADMDQNVTPAVFKQQMQLLKSSGIPILPTNQAVKRIMSN